MLVEGDTISVWWMNGKVLPARVVLVAGATFSYRIIWSDGNDGATGMDVLNGEGHWWVRGTDGPQVNAFRTISALRESG